MRHLILFLTLTLALTGCASTWHVPAGSDFKRDSYACERDVAFSGLINWAASRMYARCMESKGYTKAN
jgi:hypothetical protein